MLGAERARGAAARSLALARLVGRELVPCGRDQPSARLTAARSAPANDTGRPIVASIEHRGYAPADELRHKVVRGWAVGSWASGPSAERRRWRRSCRSLLRLSGSGLWVWVRLYFSEEPSDQRERNQQWYKERAINGRDDKPPKPQAIPVDICAKPTASRYRQSQATKGKNPIANLVSHRFPHLVPGAVSVAVVVRRTDRGSRTRGRRR